MKNQVMSRMGKRAVKGMATITRSVAKSSINTMCMGFIYQPKEPKDLANRLAAMGKK